MQIESEIKLNFSDVLIKPKRSTLSSRQEVELNRTFKFRNSKASWSGVPIIAANMDGVGTMEMANAMCKHDMFTCLTKSYTVDEIVTYFHHQVEGGIGKHTAVSIGINDDDYEKFVDIKKRTMPDSVQCVCIDVANGYSQKVVNFVRKIRANYPTLTIIAGNVVTREMTEELILSGADIVKVGIGGGGMCTTRLVAGVGVPQLSAIIECADAAHGLGGHVIADGGCTHPGDVSKALAAGADFVMLGSMLSGTTQGGGDLVTQLGKPIVDAYSRLVTMNNNNSQYATEKLFVQFYGMSSKTANEKHFGGLKKYRSSEGRTALVPYKGDVAEVLQNITGGIRSTMTYVGARKLKHLSKCTTFVRCNHTHNTAYENSTIGY